MAEYESYATPRDVNETIAKQQSNDVFCVVRAEIS
jgi:hypothetical protein